MHKCNHAHTVLHHLETHFAEQQRWIFWLHWFVCSRNCRVSSCTLTTLSLVLGALSASTGFPSVESCSTGFQLLQNLVALAWSWKAMLKYTQLYYMPPPAAETIFWIWVRCCKGHRDSLLKEMYAPWHHDSLLKEMHTPWHQILNWATTQ